MTAPARAARLAAGILMAVPLAAPGGLVGARAAGAPVGWSAVTTPAGRAFQLVEPAFTLRLPPGSADLTVTTPQHPQPFLLPVVALVGRTQLPVPVRFAASAAGAQLTLSTIAGSAGFCETTLVTGSAAFFTVKVLAQTGPAAGPVEFFDGGTKGTAMRPVTGGYTPDPEAPAALTAAPQVVVGQLGTRYSDPFSPPPLMVGLDTSAGWLGLGFVGVPNASVMGYQPGGGLAVNFPLATLAGFQDRGAGGRVPPPATPDVPGTRPAAGTWLGFPRLVVTVAGSPTAALGTYSAALSALGLARAAYPPGTRPAWWRWPFADTWGEQFLVDGLTTRRPLTAAWVRQMVADWRTRFGLQHFTVVIDHGWESELGSAIPSAGFGGLSGMRALINQLHAEGLRVVLWWPLWLEQRTPQGPRVRLDPTAPGFGAAMQAAMRTMLGSGPGQLDADGIKFDWGYLVPQPSVTTFARPADGVGAAAILYYLQLLQRAAVAVDPTVLLDGEAAAPQFDAVEGMLRLYDASTNLQWSQRATIAAIADPKVAIDGDGFLMASTQAAPHLVSSTVYGTPALYYTTQWGGGQPIPPAEAHDLGLVLNLSAQLGQGEAVPLADGGWAYQAGGRVVAETLAGDYGLVVFQLSSCGRPVAAEVVTTVAGPLAVPVSPGSTVAGVAAQPGGAIAATEQAGLASFPAVPGVLYTLRYQAAACP